ncbi:MAG TPA: uroporphyrinogen-III C-methyltransferase [Syntrophorhabdaceae bacterium]|jgi:uroporphyrinogen III methyltransferase/synthase
MGKVYLVGAGPGDPKLITVKGREVIRRADTVIYDYLAHKDILAFARADAEVIYVGKQASRHAMSQDGINALLVEKALLRETVVRLKGGDPYIFGRGGEEAAYLAERAIQFEVVPGITSAIAVPAYAGIPLTYRGYASTVAFITGHEDERKEASAIRWHELATGIDTLVFLMGMKHLGEIARRLIEEGRDPDTDACVIQWGTLPTQRSVTGPLKDIERLVGEAGISPPGIIVVGAVISLKEKLGWFERRPLFGKRVAVTRASHQSAKLGELLVERGAEVIYAPTIEIVPIEPNLPLSAAIEGLKDYFCIIFTSVNGASIFFEALRKQGKDSRSLGPAKVLPIGTATARFLESRGIVPDHMPHEFTQEGIVRVLDEVGVKGRRFLLPRAEEGRDVVTKYIQDGGGVCDQIPIYRTELPRRPEAFASKPDIITFTSSSTVRNFMTLYGADVLKEGLIASIGPITTETLRKYGIEPHITASRYDIQGLVDAVTLDALQRKDL